MRENKPAGPISNIIFPTFFRYWILSKTFLFIAKQGLKYSFGILTVDLLEWIHETHFSIQQILEKSMAAPDYSWSVLLTRIQLFTRIPFQSRFWSFASDDFCLKFLEAGSNMCFFFKKHFKQILSSKYMTKK